MQEFVNSIYKKLYSYFGPQHWWPAETAFEVILGAILTQNTAWTNVEKAILRLKKKKLLNPGRLKKASFKKIAACIMPAGYYNIKTKRLKEFLKYFFKNYQADIRKMSRVNQAALREELLAVNGIGPETADSILLYALNKPVFVVDAYTKRIFSRHNLIKEDAPYNEAQNFFLKRLKEDTQLFNQYHALLVKLGKDFCLKNKPRCEICPLKLKMN
ncbi:MAG: endonuclease III domain-containing protein [Candidatus Omnitrophota bacterium]